MALSADVQLRLTVGDLVVTNAIMTAELLQLREEKAAREQKPKPAGETE